MQKMRFFRRCLPLFLAFWLLLAVAGAPFAAYAGESVTVRDSSGQVRYAAPIDPENACPALQSALDTVRCGAYGTCTVTVTPGKYRMTKSAVLASDMTLDLTGVTLLNANAGKGNIFISPNRDRTGKDYTGYSALENCTLRGGTVTNSRSSAVCIVDSNGVEVTENTIRTGATNGIFMQRSKKARLLRNTIQAMGHNGICLAEKSTAATGSNRISGCCRYGMSSQPGTALTTVGDRLTGNTKGQGIAQGSKNMKFSTLGSTRLVGGRIRRGKYKGKIALQWKAVPGAKQYVLYRRDGSIRGKYRRVVTLTGTCYIDTAPKRGKTAAYRLVAQTKTNGVTAQSPVARAAVRIKG